MSPKLIALALRRCSAVTCSRGTPNTSAAVARWMSSPPGGDDAVSLPGHEGLADAASLGGAYRDVLQVGIRRGEPPGGGHCLVVGGVNPSRIGVDQLRQLVGVGGLELAHAAELQDQPRQREVQRQLLQHRLGGGGLSLGSAGFHRQLQLLEQDALDLLGGASATVPGSAGFPPPRTAAGARVAHATGARGSGAGAG